MGSPGLLRAAAALPTLLVFLTITATTGATALPSSGPPPPPPSPPPFGFGDVFGSWMVLQQQPAKAAVYGYMGGPAGTAVRVTATNTATGASFSAQATLGVDATMQRRPNYTSAGTPFPGPFNTWKALLPPQAPGGDYTITAVCTGCSDGTSATLTNVTFGDMWFCTGQSNMWLPMDHTFSRNDTVRNITAGKYNNIRLMAGPSAESSTAAAAPWMTALQAVSGGNWSDPDFPLFQFGASCFYYARRLAELGVSVPIGITDTAIGGQRIALYMENSTINTCSQRLGMDVPIWDGQDFAKMVVPYVDLTVKGWVWYQGENDMGGVKGSSIHNIGYSCEQRVLVEGYRRLWSKEEGTTDPMAPFGIVTLASSGAEGADQALGAMRIAQTTGYGTLPAPGLPNTFLAQAYDLDDPWGPAAGPCIADWGCCDKNGRPVVPTPSPPPPPDPHKPADCSAQAQAKWLHDTDFHTGVDLGSAPGDGPGDCCEACGNATLKAKGCIFFTWANGSVAKPPQPSMCWFKRSDGGQRHLPGAISGGIQQPGPPSPAPPSKCVGDYPTKCTAACAAAADTPVAMGGIHPRDKKPVGDRLGTAAFNLVYGGERAYTGPTLSSCSVAGGKLTIRFNTTLLRGDRIVLQEYGPETPARKGNVVGGSYLNVQTDPAAFCLEPHYNSTTKVHSCPTWAGGSGLPTNASLDGGWTTLNISAGPDGASIVADLAPLQGVAPSAVRYAWNVVSCCDTSDPDLFVTHGCGPASCPIMASSGLPANPWLARIVDGHCSCIPPQVCS